MLEVNPWLQQIEVSVIRKIAEECNVLKKDTTTSKKLINLTIGEPDLPQPKIVIDETIEFMKKGNLGYPQLGGYLELREEIAKFYNQKYGVNYSADEVIVNVGSSEGLATAIKTVVQIDDEVIVQIPFYPAYEPLIHMCRGKIVKVDTSDSEFEMTVEKIKENMTEKTRAIVLNYPSNPTGVTISKKNRDEILKFAKENNLYIISDEVYSEIIFEGEHNSFASDEYKENVIVVNGFSKSHSMTGWRIGYILSGPSLRKELLKVHQYNVTSATAMSQYGAIVALKKCSDVTSNMEIYKERALEMYGKFIKNGVNAIKPKGSIYLFVSLKEFGIVDSLEFSMNLLKEQRVAVVPGIAFDTEGYIRISLVQDKIDLLEATDRIISFLNKNKK